MTWNWTHPDWPRFAYDAAALEPYERRFLLASGEALGVLSRVEAEAQDLLRIEILSDEALSSSEIEGEILDRRSLRSCLRREFGLDAEPRPAKPGEQGIAEMIAHGYKSWAEPLDHATLFKWHRMLFGDDCKLESLGAYRTHQDAMRIVSGRMDRPTIHYVAPPSERAPAEMEAYVSWFNASAPQGAQPLSALTRAGIGHFYFECVHPFEDGNGRLGRALAEKSLAQSLGRPSLTALASVVAKDRKAYYAQLGAHQKGLEITGWLIWFAKTALEAQKTTLRRLSFLIEKTRFLDRLQGRLNPRQEKALLRMLREGPEGFRGGLSAENYLAIARTSRATATRDLQDLVEQGALTRRGERRQARYALNMPEPPESECEA